MEIMIKRIDNAINSGDPAVMVSVLNDLREFIQHHTLNYDLPEKWSVNDLFRLPIEEYNKMVAELLDGVSVFNNTDNLLDILVKLRQMIKGFAQDRYGLPKTIILVTTALETINQMMQGHKQ